MGREATRDGRKTRPAAKRSHPQLAGMILRLPRRRGDTSVRRCQGGSEIRKRLSAETSASVRKLRFRGRKYGPADVLILGWWREAARLCSGGRSFTQTARERARGRQAVSGWEDLCRSESEFTQPRSFPVILPPSRFRVQSSPRHSTGRYLFLSKANTRSVVLARTHTFSLIRVHLHTHEDPQHWLAHA